jgi:hypothetical protein
VQQSQGLMNNWAMVCGGVLPEDSRSYFDSISLFIDGIPGEEQDSTMASIESSSDSRTDFDVLLVKFFGVCKAQNGGRLFQEDHDYINRLFPEHWISDAFMTALLVPDYERIHGEHISLLVSAHESLEHAIVAVAGLDIDEYEKEAYCEKVRTICHCVCQIRNMLHSLSACELIDGLLQLVEENTIAKNCLMNYVYDAFLKENLQTLSQTPIGQCFLNSRCGKQMLMNERSIEGLDVGILDEEARKSLLFARASIPTWTLADTMLIVKASDFPILLIDPLVILLPVEKWKIPEVACELGTSIPFLAISRVRGERLFHMAALPLCVVSSLDDFPRLMEMGVKWLIRWELHFMQWLLLTCKVADTEESQMQVISAYMHVLITEKHTRQFLCSKLKKILPTLVNDAKSKSGCETMIALLKSYPISPARSKFAFESKGSENLKDDLSINLSDANLDMIQKGEESNPQANFFANSLKSQITSLNQQIRGNSADTALSLSRSLHKCMFPKVPDSRKNRTKLIETLISWYVPQEQQKHWLLNWRLCCAINDNGELSGEGYAHICELNNSSSFDYSYTSFNDLMFMNMLFVPEDCGLNPVNPL